PWRAPCCPQPDHAPALRPLRRAGDIDRRLQGRRGSVADHVSIFRIFVGMPTGYLNSPQSASLYFAIETNCGEIAKKRAISPVRNPFWAAARIRFARILAIWCLRDGPRKSVRLAPGAW